jgi:hypothetical protein
VSASCADTGRGRRHPVQDGHPQIHLGYVGVVPLDQFERRAPVARLPDDLDAALVREQSDHAGSHHGVIIRHDDTQTPLAHASTSSAEGITARIRVPSPTELVTASLPPSSASRLRMPSSPKPVVLLHHESGPLWTRLQQLA